MADGPAQIGRYFETNPSPSRLVVWTPETFDQLLSLPLGTEMVLFTVVASGHGIAGTVLTVNEEFRIQTRKYVEDGAELTVDFAVYVLPDDVVPDEVPESTETGD